MRIDLKFDLPLRCIRELATEGLDATSPTIDLCDNIFRLFLNIIPDICLTGALSIGLKEKQKIQAEVMLNYSQQKFFFVERVSRDFKQRTMKLGHLYEILIYQAIVTVSI
jgi:hypothetical protein